MLSFRSPSAKLSSAALTLRVTPVCENISDEELIAQLKDRPLLVQLRDDGSREIMLLQN